MASYSRIINASEAEADAMLRKGWTLHSVTALVNGGVLYHFVRE